jgi:hypothetical protein
MAQCLNLLPNNNEGAGAVQVADHLGVAELQAGWRESNDATLARHYPVPAPQGSLRHLERFIEPKEVLDWTGT